MKRNTVYRCAATGVASLLVLATMLTDNLINAKSGPKTRPVS